MDGRPRIDSFELALSLNKFEGSVLRRAPDNIFRSIHFFNLHFLCLLRHSLFFTGQVSLPLRQGVPGIAIPGTQEWLEY